MKNRKEPKSCDFGLLHSPRNSHEFRDEDSKRAAAVRLREYSKMTAEDAEYAVFFQNHVFSETSNEGHRAFSEELGRGGSRGKSLALIQVTARCCHRRSPRFKILLHDQVTTTS